MNKKLFVVAALVLVGSAAVLFLGASPNVATNAPKGQFVRQRGGRFFVGQKPFRFVGANVALMYRDEDRERMPETLRQAAQAGNQSCARLGVWRGRPKRRQADD